MARDPTTISRWYEPWLVQLWLVPSYLLFIIHETLGFSYDFPLKLDTQLTISERFNLAMMAVTFPCQAAFAIHLLWLNGEDRSWPPRWEILRHLIIYGLIWGTMTAWWNFQWHR